MKKMSVLSLMTFALICCASAAFARGQDIVRMSADIDIPRDMVAGDVVAIGGDITVAGKVENNVVAVGGSVKLKSRSYVGGQVVVVGGEIVKEEDVVIGGRITQIYMPHFIPSITNFLKGGWLAIWATISMLVLLGFLGLAVLLVALLPDHVGTAVSALERSFAAMFIWGVLWTILIVPIAVLLAVSIVGIVLIPLEILLVVLGLILGYIASAIFIGKNTLLAFKKMPPPFVDAILGIIILALVGLIPILGSLIKVIFLIAGFGAVLTTRFGTTR